MKRSVTFPSEKPVAFSHRGVPEAHLNGVKMYRPPPASIQAPLPGAILPIPMPRTGVRGYEPPVRSVSRVSGTMMPPRRPFNPCASERKKSTTSQVK